MSSQLTQDSEGGEVETWGCFLPKCKWTHQVSYGKNEEDNPYYWSRKFSRGVAGDRFCSEHIRTHWQYYFTKTKRGRKLIAAVYGTRWKETKEKK
jgi:hypothetical protein